MQRNHDRKQIIDHILTSIKHVFHLIYFASTRCHAHNQQLFLAKTKHPISFRCGKNEQKLPTVALNCQFCTKLKVLCAKSTLLRMGACHCNNIFHASHSKHNTVMHTSTSTIPSKMQSQVQSLECQKFRKMKYLIALNPHALIIFTHKDIFFCTKSSRVTAFAYMS